MGAAGRALAYLDVQELLRRAVEQRGPTRATVDVHVDVERQVERVLHLGREEIGCAAPAR